MWGRSKKKNEDEPVFTGFIGDMSDEQKQVLDSFKEWIEKTGLGNLARMHFDDHDLLRFCRAQKFVPTDVQQMWENFINWRREYEVDDIIDNY